MSLTYTPAVKSGWVAPDFSLPGVDGKTYSLSSFGDAKALLVIFMCNHCPYVIAVNDRINALAKEFGPRGLALVGINSNDSVRYPEDSFPKMKEKARELGFVFPYLWDESQEVARAYDAVCTPDPFLFDSGFQLRYRGRIDDSWKDESHVKSRDLAKAIEAVLEGKSISQSQISSMGCSIKWKV